MNAYAYLRVSGASQLDGDGFERQMIACNLYAALHDLVIADVFKEEAVPGKTELENRPALMDLLAAMEANGVKVILIEKLDRLARDLMVQETIIADLRKRGYTLISVAEPDLCVDDPSRKLMRQIFGAIAEYDRTMIVMKLRGARQRKKSNVGRCEGQKPFGHYPDEVVTLEQIHEWKATGSSVVKIAEQLNAIGMKSRSGVPWTRQTIGKILSRGLVTRDCASIAL